MQAPADQQRRRARNGQWSLDELRSVVDQFVIHYDACGTSEVCFRVLQDQRDLSVQQLPDTRPQSYRLGRQPGGELCGDCPHAPGG